MNVYIVVGASGIVLRVYDTAARAEAFTDALQVPASVQKWQVEE